MSKLDKILSHIPRCAIEWNRAGSEFGYKLTQPQPVRIEEESRGVMVTFSAENGDGIAEYWDSLRIHPDLEAWAEKFGSYFEWENPGAISVFFEEVQA